MARKTGAETPTAGALEQRRALAPHRPPRNLISSCRGRLRNRSRGITPLGFPQGPLEDSSFLRGGADRPAWWRPKPADAAPRP
eukprot:15468560-Alexandrium_andersonii.AAC.1